jgi:hypothetical protein
MWFFDSIVDQAQAQTATSMTTKQAPMEMTADSLIILDDAPSNTHLESALGLTGAAAPTEAISPVVMFDTTAENTQASSGFGLLMETTEASNTPSEMVELMVPTEDSTEEVTPVSEISEISEIFDSAPENVLVENGDPLFSLVSDTETTSPVPDVEITSEVTSEVTPESILSEAIARLQMISDTTDAKRQSALDLEANLLAQISDEIQAHKAKIADLEVSAAAAKAAAEQIELDGRKTKDRIILLEKELEAV